MLWRNVKQRVHQLLLAFLRSKKTLKIIKLPTQSHGKFRELIRATMWDWWSLRKRRVPNITHFFRTELWVLTGLLWLMFAAKKALSYKLLLKQTIRVCGSYKELEIMTKIDSLLNTIATSAFVIKLTRLVGSSVSLKLRTKKTRSLTIRTMQSLKSLPRIWVCGNSYL